MGEHDRADRGRGQAGDQDRARRDVQATLYAALRFHIQSVEQRLDRAVEQFRREHEADAADDDAPLVMVAFEYEGRGERERREEEVDEETGVPTYAALHAAERLAELVAPAPRRLPRR